MFLRSQRILDFLDTSFLQFLDSENILLLVAKRRLVGKNCRRKYDYHIRLLKNLLLLREILSSTKTYRCIQGSENTIF